MLVSKPGLFLLPLRGLPQWRAMKAGEGKRVFKPSPPGLYQQLNVPSEGHIGNPSPQFLGPCCPVGPEPRTSRSAVQHFNHLATKLLVIIYVHLTSPLHINWWVAHYKDMVEYWQVAVGKRPFMDMTPVQSLYSLFKNCWLKRLRPPPLHTHTWSAYDLGWVNCGGIGTATISCAVMFQYFEWEHIFFPSLDHFNRGIGIGVAGPTEDCFLQACSSTLQSYLCDFWLHISRS